MNNFQQHLVKVLKDHLNVVVGVSGGADSMSLLHALLHCDHPFNITAAHVNHLLRDEESMRDEAFVMQFCADNNVPCHVKRIDIEKCAKQEGLSIELCGRERRYQFFEELRGDGVILTAHTLSDRVETLLFNLTRGSSLAGLCSIPEQRGHIVRPFLAFTRQEIEQYCTSEGVPYIQDSSNFSTDYTRNKIRIHVVPVLKQINSGFDRNAERLMNHVARDQDFLSTEANAQYQRLNTQGALDLNNLNLLHPAIQSRVLIHFLQDHQISYSTRLIDQLTQICEDQSGKINVAKDLFIQADEKQLIVRHTDPKIPYFEFVVQNTEQCDMGQFRIICCNRINHNKFIKIYKNFFIYVLDYDRIFGNVKIRQRLPQDSLCLPRRHTKTLKKLFNELAIPVYHREQLSVFADDNGVLGVDGVGIDQRVIPTDQTQNYLLIVKKNADCAC